MVVVRFTQGGDYQLENSLEATIFQQREYPDAESFISLITTGGGDFAVNGVGDQDIVAAEETPAKSATDGIYADFSGEAAHFYLYGGARGDVLIGGDNTDELRGEGGDDLLIGGALPDQFFGGEGIDTVSYDRATAGVQVGAPPFITADDAAGDSFDSIEVIIGSDFADTFESRGSIVTSTLEGGAGGDTFIAFEFGINISYAHAASGVVADIFAPARNTGDAAGDVYIGPVSTLTGSQHDDQLTGSGNGNGNIHYLNGLDGNDQLASYTRNAVFNGGEGSDTVSYASSNVSWYASLNDATGTRGGDGDTYTSIENLTGSAFDDVLIGNGEANVLTGGDGADRLFGRGGADSLLGEGGSDKLVVNNNPTKVDGGSGTDTLVIAGGSSVTFAADSITGIERINVLAGASLDLSALETAVAPIRLNGGTFTLTSLVGSQGDDKIAYDGGMPMRTERIAADTGPTGILIEINPTGVAISAGDGDDAVRLKGEINSNLLSGGDGYDTLIIGATDKGGVDVSRSNTKEALFSGFERVILKDGASLNLSNQFSDTPDLIRMFTSQDGFAQVRASLGDDLIYGGAGTDTILGSAGADVMLGGGNADTFQFETLGEMSNSATGKTDAVRDFSHAENDKLFLAFVTDETGEMFYDFTFIGTDAFTGAGGSAHEVRVEQGPDGASVVQFDINQDGAVDASFLVYSDAALTRSDFVFLSDFAG